MVITLGKLRVIGVEIILRMVNGYVRGKASLVTPYTLYGEGTFK